MLQDSWTLPQKWTLRYHLIGEVYILGFWILCRLSRGWTWVDWTTPDGKHSRFHSLYRSCIETWTVTYWSYCNTMRSLSWSTTLIHIDSIWGDHPVFSQNVQDSEITHHVFDVLICPQRYLNTKASDLRFQFAGIHKCIAFYSSSCFLSCCTSIPRTNTCLHPCWMISDQNSFYWY